MEFAPYVLVLSSPLGNGRRTFAKMLWQKASRVIKTYPIRNGITNTTSCLYPKRDAKLCLDGHEATWVTFFTLGSAERVSDSGGSSDARSCSYEYCDSPEVCGCFSDRFLEGGECDCHSKAALQERAQFHRGVSLGSGDLRYPRLDLN